MSAAARSMYSLLLASLVALLVGSSPVVAAQGDDEALILVAQPQLQDALYGATILLAKPMPDGSSLGFILNKPTPVTLGQLFPGHEPSLKVAESVFLGGPVGTNMIVALVERPESPGVGSLEIAPGLFLAVNGEVVDRIIENEPEHARFYAGVVVWRPGELAEELKRGFWYEMQNDTQLVFRKQTKGLWEELVQRGELTHKGI
jgi:putative transcriptional regulator